ncbi:hypothetical protein [Methylopila sp. M107]|uniref:hypothetical protein n=1 Tax=Methylopila sp. M107 TaxID=1101190 RepID=UPI000382EA34|nr:hypothetical protein [Methylopila sp. M107]
MSPCYAGRVKIGRTSLKRSITRNVLSVVAAYLLVLQAAVAGVAGGNMPVRPDLATQVMCLNVDAGSTAPDDREPAPFACCGLACLVGAQALEGPADPELSLVHPLPRAFGSEAAASDVETRPSPTEGSGPRAPPAAG